ncbi:hypothetical protein [Herbaspirillum autotrophicum]|uniref:hypothetical protein n=1 Tax=Herbaspirillum autotrophicum TaxID=180195 RepID=UPI0012EE4083|nr:hypothetical protein [Herbaspirillum autotrophicum]
MVKEQAVRSKPDDASQVTTVGNDPIPSLTSQAVNRNTPAAVAMLFLKLRPLLEQAGKSLASEMKTVRRSGTAGNDNIGKRKSQVPARNFFAPKNLIYNILKSPGQTNISVTRKKN